MRIDTHHEHLAELLEPGSRRVGARAQQRGGGIGGRAALADARGGGNSNNNPRPNVGRDAQPAPASPPAAGAAGFAESAAPAESMARAPAVEPGSLADYAAFWGRRPTVLPDPPALGGDAVEAVVVDADVVERGPRRTWGRSNDDGDRAFVGGAGRTPQAFVDPPVAAAPVVTPQLVTPPVAAAPDPVPTPAAALPAAPATPASGYVGERPVEPAWLAVREVLLAAVRSDYEAALARAQASPGVDGAGWSAAVFVTDESGQMRAADQGQLAFVADSAAPAAFLGNDESGYPVYGPAGRWWAFDQPAFAAWYQARAGAPLQALAAHYGSSDAAGLLGAHPELWRIATTEHALNAGPAPAGLAMGDAAQLGMLDLYLADPQIAALITAYGGSPAPAAGGIALEQVRLYGEQRYLQLTRLGTAMAAVREHYRAAIDQARVGGAGPGWVERPVTITDESGAHIATASGFDPDAFTAWYLRQPGLSQQTFGAFYGASQSVQITDESGQSHAGTVGFAANPSWTMQGAGGVWSHQELVAVDPNDPPDLIDDRAVGFDLEVGWATHRSNIEPDDDWFGTLVQVVMVAAVAWVSGGTLGPAAAGAMGLTTTAATGAVALTATGAVVSAAVAGAATSLASGMLSGDVNLKDIVRGALSAALTVGLGNAVRGAVGQIHPVGSIALRGAVQGAVQGGVQELLGGSFRDGALAAGAAGALAELTQAGIDEALRAQALSPEQLGAARTFSRVVGSAIRAAANPGDPTHAFASAFVDDLFRQLDPPVLGGAAEPVEEAAPVEASAPRPLELGLDPLVSQGRFVPDAEHDRTVLELNAELGIDVDAAPSMLDNSGDVERDPDVLPVGWIDDARLSAADYAQRLASRIGGELGDLFQRGARAANAWLSYGDISALQSAKADIKGYLDARAERGDLSEAEIVLLGTLYAATETLFPENLLDFAGGIGKGVSTAGALIVAGRSADALATTARAANVEQAIARQVQAVEQAAHARGLQVVREVPGSRGQWNDALSGALKPDAVYLLDNGHAYMTDSLGRVARTEGVLDLKRMDRNTYQQLMAGKVGGEGYDGGHLIAALLGGAGERINLLPQLSSVNRGEYREMERLWAEAIRAGKEVKVEISPTYISTSPVPDQIQVRYWIDGRPDTLLFPNRP